MLCLSHIMCIFSYPSPTDLYTYLHTLSLHSALPISLLWLRTAYAGRKAGHFYAPELAELGGDPNRLLLVETGDAKALLAAANDAVRCAGDRKSTRLNSSH